MKKLLKEFWYEEEGLGTLEIVLIIIVIIGMVVVFRETILEIFVNVINGIKGDAKGVDGSAVNGIKGNITN